MSDAKLRILHASEVHWGGVVTLLRQYVAEQAAAGHEVHVLAPAGMPALEGATMHDWPVERSRPQTFRGAVATLHRAIETLQPDVVHLHSFVAGQLGRLPGGKVRGFEPPAVVYQPHAWSNQLFTSRLACSGVVRAERWASRRTDMLVTNCQDEIDAGRRLGVVLPARPLGVAVDLEELHTVSAEERQRHRDDLGVGGRRVLTVLGRIAHQKGQDLLVPAWERRHREGELLVLVGPGDTTELQAMAPTQWGRSIIAVGEPDSVLPWLWASDLLLTPSRYETVGLVVAEALSTGLPVVATDFDGAAETITGSGLPAAGAVVPLGDMDQLLDAVEERLDDESLMGKERTAARARAERLFQPEVMAQRLEAAYRDALTSVRGGVLL